MGWTRFKLEIAMLPAQGNYYSVIPIKRWIELHLFFDCHFFPRCGFMFLQLCGINWSVASWSRELACAINKFKGRALLSSILL